MEVRPGYKNTKVGIIPEDWDVYTFGELAQIERGKFTARPRNDPKYYGGDIPFIQTGDVTNANGHITTYSQTLNAEGLKVSKLFPRGTLFFTIAANIGDVGFATFDSACPDSLVAITPTKKTDKTWLSYELAQRKASFEGIATHNAQLNINLEKLRPYLLPLPPLPEQQAIAAALSDVDALLEGLTRLIAKNRNLKQAAIQQLLIGQTRLPGFQEEWKVKRLGDHVTFLRHGVNSRAELTVDGPVKYLHYGDVHACTGVLLAPDDLPSLPSEKATTLDRLRDGDLIFADASEDLEGVSKSVEMCRVGSTPVVAGLHTIAARFDKRILADGFKAYLQFSPVFAGQLRRLAAGTKVYAINRAHIASIEMSLPGADEQTAIASVLNDMNAEIEALEGRRDKTQALKQAMMQELLTGKTRLVEPASANEAAC